MRFDEFLKEREYLLGVTRKTLIYYKCAFNSWNKHATDGMVLTWIQGMKAAGLSNISINTYICAMRAYFKWAEPERKRISYLKEENKVLSTFSPEDIKRFINWKPVRSSERRLHTLTLLLLDSGIRIEECINLRRDDLDFPNLSFRVKGKGNKHRLVPMSIELRKLLFRYVAKAEHDLLFCTRDGHKLSQRNLLRDFKALCARLGISDVRCSFHTLRHSFSVSYLRVGGDLYFLSRILGHESIKTTELYLKSLGIDDFVKEHSRRSILSQRS